MNLDQQREADARSDVWIVVVVLGVYVGLVLGGLWMVWAAAG